MGLERKRNWIKKYDQAIVRASKRKFEWGKFDCGLFACDVVEAMTGVNVGKPFRAKYKTEKGAIGALKRVGGGGIERAAKHIFVDKHGCEEIDVPYASRGDVVSTYINKITCLGIVSLSGTSIYVASERGIVEVPIRKARRAWRI